jgi:hypothetical protein
LAGSSPERSLPERRSLAGSSPERSFSCSCTTRNLLTSDPSFWSLDGHCCSTYDPLLTKNTWSAVERH